MTFNQLFSKLHHKMYKVLRLKKKINFFENSIFLRICWNFSETPETFMLVALPAYQEHAHDSLKNNKKIRNCDWVCNFVDIDGGNRLTDTQMTPFHKFRDNTTGVINKLLKSLDASVRMGDVDVDNCKLFYRKRNLICKLKSKIENAETMKVINLATKRNNA